MGAVGVGSGNGTKKRKQNGRKVVAKWSQSGRKMVAKWPQNGRKVAAKWSQSGRKNGDDGGSPAANMLGKD
ncbi:hypothetical protein, conserved [Plasmodium ovale wallikeri]|uniref:Uncharacterized protein n=1 Tax=Plasmodium ovale wallikeri TaxID=864142 RepID=A0A1A8ZEN7_PLAOA|nr:hypothetical protein, conserved [Plasmodium ovale wallikeri]